MRRIYLPINLAFLLLLVALAALTLAYWEQVLEPRLRQEGAANAATLAHTQARRLADAIGPSSAPRPARVAEAVDEILTFADAQTRLPYFEGVALELDYDVVRAVRGALDLERGDLACRDCFAADAPLFDPVSYELIGIAHFRVSDRFFRQLSADVKRNLQTEAAGGLALLAGVWLTVLWLVRHLQRATSERQRAESALARNQQRYHRLLNSLSNYFVYARDGSGAISFVSDSVARVLGYTPEQFRDGFERHLTDSPANAALRSSLEQALAGGQPPPFQIELRDRDGGVRHIECTEMAVSDPQEPATAVEGIARDVTRQREFERELKAAKERAEAANETKSRFLANVSHEVRTPMNAVLGLTALALKTDLNPKQRDYLGKIHASATSLLEIINDILDISKMEAGGMELEAIEFDLDEVLDRLAQLVGVRVEEKGLEIALATDPEVPNHLVGDPLRLGQVLLNLVNNAIKFTANGEILIRTELTSATGDHVQLRFTVRDTGIGIEPHKLPLLFQPFSQADSSNTRLYGGTGLGLAICKRLVDLMRGTIEVESRPGEGSTFRFTAVFGRPRHAPAALRIAPERLRGLRALVVDDNDLSREILGNALTGFSFRVEAAASGDEAIEKLLAAQRLADPFRLVLLDWRMPHRDGIATAEAVRRHPALREQPALLLVTAYSFDRPLARIEELGLDGFLTKPVSQSTLFDAALGALGHRVENGAAVEPEPEPAARFLPGTRVLLVEDNAINQEIATEMLREMGLTVEVAGDGAQALARLAEAPFAAVLMDIQMPVMDGIEATRRLRHDPRLKHLPVIAMTAHAMSGDAERCLAAGMNDYLSKPVEAARMGQVLRRWLPGAETAEPPPRPAAAAGQPLLPALPALPGIDMARALKQASGNAALLTRVLRRFFDAHLDTPARLTALLAAGERESARALVHTLKGEAGNLAAEGVAEAALGLERSLREGRPTASPLKELEAQLAVVLAGSPLLARASAPAAEAKSEPPAAAADPAQLGRLLERLLQQLAENDLEALRGFEQTRALLRGHAQAATPLEAIQRALDALDFDTARAQLSDLARALNLEP